MATLVVLFAAADAPARPLDGEVDCFGAAAMDPALPSCRAAARLSSVTPKPAQARRLPNSPCKQVRRAAPPVCAFGAPAAGASQTIALVGDSHAGHWRAALSAVAHTKN